MATSLELEEFLSNASARAFKKAFFSVKNEEQAMDLVQDSMMKLAEKYADRPVKELGPLFTRILQNSILDHYRRQKVRNTWTTLFSSFQKAGEEEYDVLETGLGNEHNAHESAEDELDRSQKMALIEQAIAQLPERQRQAFLLRYWEEMDLAETAAIMGCSEGSVKTHCSRANKALSALLETLRL